MPRRTGLELAREALASARAEARRRGLAPGTPAARSTGDAGSDGSGAGGGSPAEQRSGARPDDRDPQLLGPTVDRLIAERGWETDAAVGGVLGRWAADRRAGGRRALPSRRPSTTASWWCGADSTAWATQVRLLAPTLLARLTEELGPAR